jgi:hypothetical protein
MALFDNLNRTESALFEGLCKVPDNTIWGRAISNVMATPTVKKFRELVKQLKSQAKDNEQVMESILGTKTLQLLKAA